MAKNEAPSADILAAINKAAAEGDADLRRKLGLKPKDPVVTGPVVQAADVAVSEKPAIAPVSGDGHPADVERAKKGGAGRKRVINKKKGAPARGGKKTPAVKSAKPSGAAVSDPVVLEEDAKPPVNLPEWGVVRDSVYESRMTVPAAHPPLVVVPAASRIEDIQIGPGQEVSGAVSWKMGDIGDFQEEKENGVFDGSDQLFGKDVKIAAPGSSAEAEIFSSYGLSEDGRRITDKEIATDRLGILRGEAAELRAKYVSRQYEHGRMMERLKRSPIGRFLGKGDADAADLEYWKMEYGEKVTALREAELEALKHSGLEGRGLRDAMAGLLRASKVDEALELIKARDGYRLEGRNLSDRAYNAFRSAAEAYNRLPKKTKIMAGLAIGALAIGSAGLGGASLAVGAKIVRRIISSAGLAIAADAALDAKLEERFRERAEREIEAELAEFFDPIEAAEEGVAPIEKAMRLFEERLKAASGEADPAFRELLSGRRANALAGAAVGTIVGFAGSAAAEWFHESGAAHTAKEILLGQDAVPAEMTDIELADRTAAIRAMAEEYGSASPERQLEIRNVTGMTDGQFRASARTVEIMEGHVMPSSAADALPVDTNGGGLARTVLDDPDALGHNPESAASDAAVPEEASEAPEYAASEDTPDDPSGAGSDARTQPEFSQALQPRVDDWFSQIFRIDGEMPGSGRDWVIDHERLANIRISDMIKDAALYQQGGTSGFRTGLSAEQLRNFAQFFQNVGTGAGDREAMEGIIRDTMRDKEMTVAEYLEKIAPLAKQGQRFGLFTTTY